MKKLMKSFPVRWLLPAFSLFLLTTCDKSIKPDELQEILPPRYVFTEGETQFYDLELSVDAALSAAVIDFVGTIEMSVGMSVTPEGTNEYGTILDVDLYDPVISGGTAQISTVVLQMLTYARNYFSTVYITPEGTVTILHDGKPSPALQAAASLILPDFSVIGDGESTERFETNFGLASTDLGESFAIDFERESVLRSQTASTAKVDHNVEINGYELSDYRTSVSPSKIAAVEIDITDSFDTEAGKIESKKGYLYASLSYDYQIMSFITTHISGTLNGSFKLKTAEDPSLKDAS